MKTQTTVLSLFILLLFAVGCDSFNDRPDSTEARVNFRLVDAPADYDEVWIEVLALRVKANHKGGEMDENDDSWNEIVYDGPKMVNLLNLTGGNSILLGSENFPEGEIDQIRLILGDNNYLVKDGQEITLKTPSAQQSGLKIKVDQEIHGGESYDLIIDFDAAKSIVTAGNSGNVILKPVLRAYLEESQGIQGQVLPLEAQPIMVTIAGQGAEVNTFADKTGKYAVMGLVPGSYSITLTPNENYLPQTLSDISVTENEVTIPPAVTLASKP
ncbi:hypothetical protein GCM10009119_04520 [Algoriphagus jejuensis]|uniref:DUF4382 domain-containing protein n=1 Tax=Algoriphagus jejuensis TaxID=419934 RepID=A0ABN1MWC2_9BACT